MGVVIVVIEELTTVWESTSNGIEQVYFVVCGQAEGGTQGHSVELTRNTGINLGRPTLAPFT